MRQSSFSLFVVWLTACFFVFLHSSSSSAMNMAYFVPMLEAKSRTFLFLGTYFNCRAAAVGGQTFACPLNKHKMSPPARGCRPTATCGGGRKRKRFICKTAATGSRFPWKRCQVQPNSERKPRWFGSLLLNGVTFVELARSHCTSATSDGF